MGLREKLNQSKWPGVAIAGAMLAVAAVAVWSNRGPSALSSAFFSTDDGHTFFKDDIRKAAPFDYNGKTAVRAYVYQSGDAPPVVGYLERFKPEERAKGQQLLEQNDGSLERLGALDMFLQGDVSEVKRPGDAKWAPANSDAAARLRAAAAKDMKPVYP